MSGWKALRQHLAGSIHVNDCGDGDGKGTREAAPRNNERARFGYQK